MSCHKEIKMTKNSAIPASDFSALGFVTIFGTNGLSELSILSLNWICGRRMLRAVSSLYLLDDEPDVGVIYI